MEGAQVHVKRGLKERSRQQKGFLKRTETMALKRSMELLEE
jgi:hypothetical protein